jgi:phosphoesterase RecJ-like protein
MLSAALGRAVLEPEQARGHGLVWTTVTRQDRAAARVPYEIAESVIDVVRRTEEAEVAVVFKEADDGCWHVSARSKGLVDVARACVALGGGGHSRAAGFSTGGTVPDALARLRALLAADPGEPAAPAPRERAVPAPREPGPGITAAARAAADGGR